MCYRSCYIRCRHLFIPVSQTTHFELFLDILLFLWGNNKFCELKKKTVASFSFLLHFSRNFTYCLNKWQQFLQKKYSFQFLVINVELWENNGTFYNEAITLVTIILVGRLHCISLKQTYKIASHTRIKQELLFFLQKLQLL